MLEVEAPFDVQGAHPEQAQCNMLLEELLLQEPSLQDRLSLAESRAGNLDMRKQVHGSVIEE